MTSASELTNSDLRDLLKFLGKQTSGNKAQLILRVESALSERGSTVDDALEQVNDMVQHDDPTVRGPLSDTEIAVAPQIIPSASTSRRNKSRSSEPTHNNPKLGKDGDGCPTKECDGGDQHGKIARSSSLLSVANASLLSAASSTGSSSSQKRAEAALKAAKLKALKREKLQLQVLNAEMDLRRREEELDVEQREAEFEERWWADREAEEMAMQDGGAINQLVASVSEGPNSRRNSVPLLRNKHLFTQPPSQRQPEDEISRNRVDRSEDLRSLINVRGDRIPRVSTEAVFGNGETDILKELVKSNDRARLPKRDLEVFGGDVTRFLLFRTSFDSTVGSVATCAAEKLSYLYQFTSGKARQLVESCLYNPGSDSYERAWILLEKEFGSTYLVSSTYLDQLLSYNAVRSDDWSGLKDFAMELAKVGNAVLHFQHGKAELENPRTIRELARKLPFRLQDGWRKLAVDIVHRNHRPASFHDFLHFVEKESLIANDPLYGRAVMEGKPLAEPGIKTREFRHKSKVTVGAVAVLERCLCCELSHETGRCPKFTILSREEKVKLLTSNKACFMCFRAGHFSQQCSSPTRCEKCYRWHNTLLHRDFVNTARVLTRGTHVSDPEQAVSSLRAVAPSYKSVVHSTQSRPHNQEEVDGDRKSQSTPVLCNTVGGTMPIVPIQVYRKDMKRVVKTAALLDSGSAITLCCKSLADKLGVKCQNQSDKLTVLTIGGECIVDGGLIEGVSITGAPGHELSLPPVYVVNEIPVGDGEVVRMDEVKRWDHLRNVDLGKTGVVEMIIGTNVPAASEPVEVVPAPRSGDPYAVKTKLGWTVWGIGGQRFPRGSLVGRIGMKDDGLDAMVRRAFEVGFEDLATCGERMSVEDSKCMQVITSGCKKVEGRYEIPLPLRKEKRIPPYSRSVAIRRAEGMKAKLEKDFNLKKRYDNVVYDMLAKGHAEKVPLQEIRSVCHAWYIPHFFVTHPMKPGKLRVVFDGAAKVGGTCLNDLLFTGPKLGSDLVDVLLRFREGGYAFTADIESMFYQVRVPTCQRNYLRFVWFQPDSDELVEYRMTTHLFGAASSPAVATYALRRIAQDSERATGEVRQTLLRNFYVDDCLRATHDPVDAARIASELREVCLEGGFRLCKFDGVPEIHSLLPENDKEIGSSSRVLGVSWCSSRDELSCDVPFRKSPRTRRGLLSFVSSVYDPLGILAPILLRGKQLVQSCLRTNCFGWDDPLDDGMQQKISNWMEDLYSFRDIGVGRNVLGCSRGHSCELHVFADASEGGHGMVAYVRYLEGEDVRLHFLFGKARVNSMKQVSIPRLELVAATLAARTRVKLEEAMDIRFVRVVMWTDSTAVLKYLRNEKDRFSVFVGNRIALIREQTNVHEWRHVQSKLNPADDASRAVQTARWTSGPSFLLLSEEFWPGENGEIYEENNSDLEIRPVVLKVSVDDGGA